LERCKSLQDMRRVNVFALAIELPSVFLLPHDPFPLLFGGLNLLLDLRPNAGAGCGGRLRFFRVGLALGGRFPLAYSSPHEGRTVGFSHIASVHKQVEHAYISSVVIQLKFLAPFAD
jgi:hypothetical protein